MHDLSGRRPGAWNLNYTPDVTRLCVTVAFVAEMALFGQGVPVREKPTAYTVQATLPTVTLAADYLVHSFPAGQQMLVIRDYLVVEVACFPARDVKLLLAQGQFTLRIDGKRTLLAQSPQFVAASLKYPDWEFRPTVVAGAGVNDASVIVGRPQTSSRFPGDPTERRRLPTPPTSPAPEHEQARQKPEAEPHELLIASALPEGPTGGPVAGCLFFPFKGKPAKLRSVELLYDGPAGSTRLSLLSRR